MRVITNAHEFVRNWVYRKIGIQPPSGPYTTIAVADDAGKLLAGCVYANYRGHDIEMVFSAEHGKWATRGVLRTFFAYPFIQCQCIRVTALIAKDNKRSRKMVATLGFKQEGTIRHGFRPGMDAVIYGMLGTECKWLASKVVKMREQRSAVHGR